MNKVFMTGRLTKDPEMTTTGQKTVIGRYSLAVETGYGDNKRTSFFECVTFNRTAQFVERYLRRGMKIFISGELQQRSYQNREGRTVNLVEILVNEHEFAESRANTEAQTGPVPERRQPAQDNDGFMVIPDDVDDEQLPFS